MKSITIVKQTMLENEKTGERISPFSAHPPGTWVHIETGKYTWAIVENDGSWRRGLGRKPAETKEEAIQIAKAIPNHGAIFDGDDFPPSVIV